QRFSMKQEYLSSNLDSQSVTCNHCLTSLFLGLVLRLASVTTRCGVVGHCDQCTRGTSASAVSDLLGPA
ncbi:hypothetical protein J6590_090640, partial [Homalodisca vitripennis]